MSPEQQEAINAIDGLSTTEMIHTFERDELGPDELYYLREELLDAGDKENAIQVDIEYGNSIRYDDDYRAKFSAQILVNIILILGSVKYNHVMAGNRRRADRVDDLADVITSNLYEWGQRHDVDLRAYLGLDIENRVTDDPDHSDRMLDAKHDSETVSTDVEPGPLDDAEGIDPEELDSWPDEADEQELHPQPQEPDTPGDDVDDDPEGA